MSVVAPIAAPLGPDVRLAKAVSEFGAGLSDKYRPVFKTWQTHSPPSETDVIRLTEEVNRDGCRLHQNSWKPFGTRLFKFLDQIQILIKPGDILVSGSQNMIASGVWATVRLSLEIATSYLSYFEKVSLLLMRLGHSTIIQRDRILLFPNDPDLKAFTCEYLIIIVDICRMIICFEGKRFFAQLAHSVTLETEFKEFETQLGFWSKVINKKLAYLNEKSQAQTSTAIATIQGNISFWAESRKREAEDWRIQVLRQLSPYQDEFESTWRRERRKGSVTWLLNDKRYTSWRLNSSSSTLLLYGSLGSGKTVAMANITGKFWPSLSTQAQSSEQGSCAVASFFCQFRNRKTLNPRTLFGSIAHQFLRSLRLSADHPAILHYRHEFTTNDTESIIDNIKTHFPRDCHYYIILDGLDELCIEDAHEVLQPLADLQDHLQLHICCSARLESSIRPMVSQNLRNTQSLSMSSPKKDREIESFIEGELQRRSHTQELDEATRKLVRDALVLGAQGMYLWVALQLNALFPLYGETVTVLEDLSHFLDRLPTGLFESFEEALGRIKDRHYGSRIFELVAASIRPLTKNELRAALNIEPGVPFWDPSTLPRDPEAIVYRCGGGLLQIDEEENTVHFIHHSALQHVLTDGQSEDAEIAMEVKERSEGDKESRVTSGFPELDRVSSRDSKKSYEEHRHKAYLFSTHQADTEMGYVCMTALHFEQHDRRLSRPRKLFVNEKTLQTISAATTEHGLFARFMTTILQRQGSSGRIPEFDIARIIEDLSAVKSSVKVSEAQLFFSYAESHWLDHTSWPCFKPKDEANFHKLFVKLIRENAPGLLFPWGSNASFSTIMNWAQSNRHLRLLYDLLCGAEGSACKSILQTFRQMPKSRLSAFSCHGICLKDVLCRFVDDEFLDVAGIDTLLALGAPPDEQYQDKSWQGLTPLQLAIQRMSEHKSYEVDVLRRLLKAGADTTGSPDGRPPILLAIDAHWAAGYQVLFSNGARVYPVRHRLGQGLSESMLLGLDLAMFRGPDADPMIQDLIACGAEIDQYFKQHSWPVTLRSENTRPADSLEFNAYSGEGDDWVNIQQVEAQQYYYLSAQDQAQAHERVLHWLRKTNSNVNISAANGMTPLGLAIVLSVPDLVREMLEAGANPNERFWGARSYYPNRPLLFAARKGSTEIVRLLFCYGASVQKLLRGKTILEMALEEESKIERIPELLFSNLGAMTQALDGYPQNLKEITASTPSALRIIVQAIPEVDRGKATREGGQKMNLNNARNDINKGIRDFTCGESLTRS
ncbi:hypothetical protein QQX98_010053 [Neonectria punicea]|uniref:NACHT domain-containing protein n=1 Tax=Neonectria punicea TaxID=979145 RepID=A0ABR1GQW0_9HYPO